MLCVHGKRFCLEQARYARCEVHSPRNLFILIEKLFRLSSNAAFLNCKFFILVVNFCMELTPPFHAKALYEFKGAQQGSAANEKYF